MTAALPSAANVAIRKLLPHLRQRQGELRALISDLELQLTCEEEILAICELALTAQKAQP